MILHLLSNDDACYRPIKALVSEETYRVIMTSHETLFCNVNPKLRDNNRSVSYCRRAILGNVASGRWCHTNGIEPCIVEFGKDDGVEDDGVTTQAVTDGVAFVTGCCVEQVWRRETWKRHCCAWMPSWLRIVVRASSLQQGSCSRRTKRCHLCCCSTIVLCQRARQGGLSLLKVGFLARISLVTFVLWHHVTKTIDHGDLDANIRAVSFIDLIYHLDGVCQADEQCARYLYTQGGDTDDCSEQLRRQKHDLLHIRLISHVRSYLASLFSLVGPIVLYPSLYISRTREICIL
ncbi:hypothetical protein KCV07_g188, partial [Aureobasidium melanogenum]